MILFSLVLLFCHIVFAGDSIVHSGFTPVGAYQNAVGMGGLSRNPSSDMVFANPSLLQNIYTYDLTVSLNDFINEPIPSVSAAGRFSHKHTLGIGFRPMLSMDNVMEKQFYISSSFAPNKMFWPGLSARYLVYEGSPALDFDVSALWNPHTLWSAGFTLENMIASKIGDSVFHRRSRTLGISGQFFWNEYYLDGINAFFKTAIDTFVFTAGAGVEKRFLKNPQIGLRAGGFYQDSAGGFSAGFIYQHDVREQRLAFEYALRQKPSERCHFISIRVGIYGALDRVPPDIEMEADLESFSPDGDGKEDVIHIKLHARENPGGVGLKSWALMIIRRDSLNHPVQEKAFVGGSIPPSTIVWDGRNSKGELVDRGTYWYQFTAVDKNENQARTKWSPIQVK